MSKKWNKRNPGHFVNNGAAPKAPEAAAVWCILTKNCALENKEIDLPCLGIFGHSSIDCFHVYTAVQADGQEYIGHVILFKLCIQ